eukprot:TRINITY_DN13118_c0_g2_i1.p1 TRINITY_DN13118_c0_g2~~TRINITY_DN13118_c0_g2_i1.p1  ORF type:complete len:125 (+),score=7.24 TRINITY_DN13118_c0_g2_i1:365-739(+)
MPLKNHGTNTKNQMDQLLLKTSYMPIQIMDTVMNTQPSQVQTKNHPMIEKIKENHQSNGGNPTISHKKLSTEESPTKTEILNSDTSFGVKINTTKNSSSTLNMMDTIEIAEASTYKELILKSPN